MYKHVSSGSVDSLRDAVLSGATTRVLWEPFPLPEDISLYTSRLYTLDTLQIAAGGTSVIGYAYTYEPNMEDKPLWTLVEFDSSGVVDMTISNGTQNQISQVSLSWLVLDREAACFQPEALSHGLPLQNPAFSVTGNAHLNHVSDVISVLQKGSTMSMISYLEETGTRAWAYPTYSVRVTDSENTLQSISTWMPGNAGFLMPLRIQHFDFSGDGNFETYSSLNTTSREFSFDFKVDKRLVKTDVFLDPCWELALSIDYTGKWLGGSTDKLLSAIQSGSRLLIVHNDGSVETVAEAEATRVFDDGYMVATSKMGVTSDEGVTWQEVTLAIDGSWWFTSTIEPPASDTGTRHFYMDKTERPFRYRAFEGSVDEGTWAEARERIKSGLIPRVMIQVSGETLLLDVECVGLAYNDWETYFMSYRQPVEGGFAVYVISMDGNFRADLGVYRSHGEQLVADSTMYDSITLFFEG
ncbi:hypothetical protein ElyMa_001278600 [Elysia marginata]|uniref:Uncharacterized protein n=1 Tax=Elysia marginata TaxID=1093978 RepID=A0AAV4IHP0_9GAST|nr:hypothetical protein ElyMa_001278600 [Elysia marginata]